MIINSNQSIPNTRINDCDIGLLVTSQQQQQERNIQEEESDGELSNRDIENMSSNNTESVHIRIDTSDPIVNQSDSTVVSDQQQESDTNGGQYVDETKPNGKDSKTWIYFIVIFFLVCTTIIIADNFVAYPEQLINTKLSLTKFLFYIIFIPLIWYSSRFCVKHNKVSNTR